MVGKRGPWVPQLFLIVRPLKVSIAYFFETRNFSHMWTEVKK